MAICLTLQNNYLLYRQLKSFSEDFLNKGGMCERMTKLRIERRKN
ncbi:MAG TPA: hypothetical protein ENN08_03740 [Bacteroidales bacterium]|nr:hypothetical protein [Bacteroidales bacterium]